MTQDQYGQTRGPGYVVRDDAVPDDETKKTPAEQSKPKTRFQKVASALRTAALSSDEPDQLADQAADGQARRGLRRLTPGASGDHG